MNAISSGERIIGGMFGVETTPAPTASHLFPSDSVFFVNATSALGVLLRSLGVARVWLPSYLCVALVRAAEYAGSRVAFYPVDRHLAMADDAWLRDVSAADAVVVIRYFGFDVDAPVAALARARGAVVIEDCAQALFGAPGTGDFTLYSPRKFLGVVDGGVLTCRKPIPEIALAAPPAPWWMKAFRASLLRHAFDLHGGPRDWFALFRDAQASAPVGPFRMSELSRTLLDCAFDYGQIRRKRCENYDDLAGALGEIALFPARPQDVVPLGFPVRLANRDRVQRRLFEQRIFPPVHWDIAGIVPDDFVDSHDLSADIMTLPCDQRYDRHDMERLALALKAAQ